MSQAGFTAQNQQCIQAFLDADHRDEVAVFDLDGTLVRNDTGEAVLYRMAHQAWFDIPTLLASPSLWEPFDNDPSLPDCRQAFEDYLKNPSTLTQLAQTIIRSYRLLIRCRGKRIAYPWAVFLLAGKTEEQVRRFSRQALQEEMEYPLTQETLPGGACDERAIIVERGLRPYQAMHQLVQQMQQRGIDVWIVTASNAFTAQEYAQLVLQIPNERVIGITPVLSQGRITTQLDESIGLTFGAGKVQAIHNLIGRQPVFAAGDTINQIDMLDLATQVSLLILKKNDPVLLERVRHHQQEAAGSQWIVQPRFIDPPALSVSS